MSNVDPNTQTRIVESLETTSDATTIYVWTLDHPTTRNSLDTSTLKWIVDRCTSLCGDIVILQSSSTSTFCSGLDLSSLDESAIVNAGTSSKEGPDANLIAATSAMLRSDATFIAAVDGYVVGGGVELVASCDLRVGTRSSVFRIPSTQFGVVYHAEGLSRIRSVFGPRGTRAMLMMGRSIGCGENDDDQRLGLAALDRCVESDELNGESVALALRLASLPVSALRGVREVLREVDMGDLAAVDGSRHRAARVRAELDRRG